MNRKWTESSHKIGKVPTTSLFVGAFSILWLFEDMAALRQIARVKKLGCIKVFSLRKAYNICHIHGIRETNYKEQKRKDMVSIGKDYCNLIIGYEEGLLNLKEHNLLYNDENIRNAIHIAKTGLIKDADQNIFNEREFFENIEKADIQNIYSVGLSYSSVDMPYIREICDRIRKSKKIKESIWYLEEYDSTERRNEFKRKITEAGYNGRYAEFRM